jgi:hypothetical protein
MYDVQDRETFLVSAKKHGTTQHRIIISIKIYWSPNFPDNTTREKIHRYLYQYVKKVMAIDNEFHQEVLSNLKGTGWYFLGELLK